MLLDELCLPSVLMGIIGVIFPFPNYIFLGLISESANLFSLKLYIANKQKRITEKLDIITYCFLHVIKKLFANYCDIHSTEIKLNRLKPHSVNLVLAPIAIEIDGCLMVSLNTIKKTSPLIFNLKHLIFGNSIGWPFFIPLGWKPSNNCIYILYINKKKNCSVH